MTGGREPLSRLILRSRTPARPFRFLAFPGPCRSAAARTQDSRGALAPAAAARSDALRQLG